MRRKVKSNPAWTDAILFDFCDSIKRAAKKHNLPQPILDSDCKIEDRSELGEGVYGVVWTTEAADCAFKLSTDSSEAHFIQTAIDLRRKGIADPAGIVDYRAVFALPVQHDDLDVFAIWREQATHVGLPCEIPKSDKEMISFVNLLDKFYNTSDTVFALAFAEQTEYSDMNQYFAWIKERVDLANILIDGGKLPYDSTFAKLLARCYKLAIEIEESGEPGRHIGHALRTYFENGILLCDVHGNNVGTVDRTGRCRESWVLTDPGHALILSKHISDTKIEMLKE